MLAITCIFPGKESARYAKQPIPILNLQVYLLNNDIVVSYKWAAPNHPLTWKQVVPQSHQMNKAQTDIRGPPLNTPSELLDTLVHSHIRTPVSYLRPTRPYICISAGPAYSCCFWLSRDTFLLTARLIRLKVLGIEHILSRYFAYPYGLSFL